jgi:hypothetical protein
MGLSGSSKLGIARLRDLAKVTSRISRDVAARIDNRVQDMFASESDPYGRAWPALKASTVKRTRGNSVVLYRKGKLRAGTRVVPARGAGVRIIFGPAAEHANEGAPNRARRLLLPEYGIPAKWRQDIRDAAAAYLASRGQAR